MRTSKKLSFAFSILALSGAFAFAQKEKANSTPPPTASEKAPIFSDDDKKKMAEIEQKSEISHTQSRTAWDAAAARGHRLQYIHNINSSAAPLSICPAGVPPRTFRDLTGYNLTTNPPCCKAMLINAIGQR